MSNKHNRPQHQPPTQQRAAEVAVPAQAESFEHMLAHVAPDLPSTEPVDPRAADPVAIASGDAANFRADADFLGQFTGAREFHVKGPESLMIDGNLKAPGTKLSLNYAMAKLLRPHLTQG
jgi:hypothetical protein